MVGINRSKGSQATSSESVEKKWGKKAQNTLGRDGGRVTIEGRVGMKWDY